MAYFVSVSCFSGGKVFLIGLQGVFYLINMPYFINEFSNIKSSLYSQSIPYLDTEILGFDLKMFFSNV